eukprot:3992473-Prymnesium_polylepis.1
MNVNNDKSHRLSTMPHALGRVVTTEHVRKPVAVQQRGRGIEVRALHVAGLEDDSVGAQPGEQ